MTVLHLLALVLRLLLLVAGSALLVVAHWLLLHAMPLLLLVMMTGLVVVVVPMGLRMLAQAPQLMHLLLHLSVRACLPLGVLVGFRAPLRVYVQLATLLQLRRAAQLTMPGRELLLARCVQVLQVFPSMTGD